MSEPESIAQVVPDRRRRLLILAICSMSLLVVSLDVTIVNVALPAIHRSFGASVSGLQWTIDAYTLVIASLLLLGGSSGDRLGRRRVFQFGLAVFSFGSLLCSLAPSLPFLIAARVVQAVGGSMLNPVAMSIIRNVFTDPRERARAIGVWGSVMGTSMALGPVVGGALVDSVSWRAVFIVNIPIGLLAIMLTALFVPESRAEHPRRFDLVGQVLVIVVLATLTYAIIEAPSAGWASAQTLGLFAVSLLAFTILVPYELRRPEPLIEVRFFRSAPFSGASATAVAMFAAMGGFLFLNTLYLQEVRGLSPFDAGLCTLPMAALMIVVSPISGRIMAASGTRVPLVCGGLAIVASTIPLIELTATTPLWLLITTYALFGIGSGLINPPITNTAVSGMPASQAGVAAGVASTSRQIGQTLGVAAIGSLAVGGLTSGIGPGLAGATHVAWWIIAALGVAIVVIGLVTTSGWARATARETADRLREGPVTAGPYYEPREATAG